MINELKVEQLEMIIGEMKHLKSEHPKATISYDTEKNRINITYPLPNDFWKLSNIEISQKHFKNIKR